MVYSYDLAATTGMPGPDLVSGVWSAILLLHQYVHFRIFGMHTIDKPASRKKVPGTRYLVFRHAIPYEQLLACSSIEIEENKRKEQ